MDDVGGPILLLTNLQCLRVPPVHSDPRILWRQRPRSKQAPIQIRCHRVLRAGHRLVLVPIRAVLHALQRLRRSKLRALPWHRHRTANLARPHGLACRPVPAYPQIEESEARDLGIERSLLAHTRIHLGCGLRAILLEEVHRYYQQYVLD